MNPILVSAINSATGYRSFRAALINASGARDNLLGAVPRGLLIGICAASFSQGGNPSYASEAINIQHFNCWEPWGNKNLKCHRSLTRLIRPSWRVTNSLASFSFLSPQIMIGIFVWSGPTFLSRAWGNQTHRGLWWNMCHELCGRRNESDFLWGVENLKFIIWMDVVKWDGNMVTAGPRPTLGPGAWRLICPMTNN